MCAAKSPDPGRLFFRRIAGPLCRAAVQLDIGYAELHRLLKTAYTAAVADLVPGGPIDEAGKRLMAGIDEAESARLLADRPAIGDLSFGMPPLANLIYAWYRRAGYGDEAGQPLDLPIAGPAPSFQALVEEFCPDTPPEELLSELIAMKTVRQTDEGRLRLTGFYSYSLKNRSTRIDHASMALASFVDTAVRRAIEGEGSKRVYRYGVSRSIPVEEMDEVLAKIESVIYEAQDRILNVLTDAEGRSRGKPTVTIGAGAFSSLDETQSLEKPR